MINISRLICLVMMDSLIGCKSAVFFDSPNSLRNINGTLYLNNGKTVEGKLIINNESAFTNTVRITPTGEKEQMRFFTTEVKGYETRGTYYALKEIRNGINIGRNISFMKRLTPEDSRIHLFENMERQSNVRNDITTTRYVYNYYLQLPGDNTTEVYALNSSKFTPNFDEKMSKIVADCPSLAQKIANKEEGYFYRQISLFVERRADVLLNIIHEYNKCK